ncbi:unnamed protein product [Symbiodinium pilosum]|uniref:Uncharacterized protein n=1 Tax=Symbiodinium pilosum TaxID=2952 RepID=A0A812LYW8_SYMPI|nr:unnamed protein product [Symbiodinium pilosum]
MNGIRADAGVIWVDLTKFGRLQNDDMNNVVDVVRNLLTHSPKTMPKHFFQRRLEDKCDAKFLTNVSINIRMCEPHTNRKQALLYPALVCFSGSDCIFEVSKLVVDRCNRDAVQWLPEREYKVPTRGKNAIPSTREDLERSCSEVQEAAQHLGGLHMPTIVIGALMQDVEEITSSSKVAVVNLAPYDGMPTYSFGDQFIFVKYCERMVAQYLLEDWKTGRNIIGAAPYNEALASAAESETQVPTFHYGVLNYVDGKPMLALPPSIRTKWSQDLSRKDDWAECLAKVHTSSAPADEPAAVGSTTEPSGAEGDSSIWQSEPRTLDELDSRYEVVSTCPGRNPQTLLRIVNAKEKGQDETKDVVSGQAHKLFLVANADVSVPASDFQLAHDRATFLAGAKVQRLLESGGWLRV